jgi:hypothetical protein
MIFFILLKFFKSIIILFKKYSEHQLRFQYLISINDTKTIIIRILLLYNFARLSLRARLCFC